MSDLISKINELHMDISEKQMHEYVSALKEFDSMIANGLVSPRGYNIKTVEHKAIIYKINHNQNCCLEDGRNYLIINN